MTRGPAERRFDGLAGAAHDRAAGRGEDVDEEPITEEEEAWGRAYWDTLAVGELEPDASHLDPARVARIREVLEARWRANVRRITHQPGRSSRK